MTKSMGKEDIFRESPLINALRLTDIELRGDLGMDDPGVKKNVLAILKVEAGELKEFRVLKRSLDRRPRPARSRFNVAVTFKSPKVLEAVLKKIPARHKARILESDEVNILRPETPSGKNIIVGAGPAGLSLAWSLALDGRDVILLERGEDVKSRLKKVGHFWARGTLNSESNSCFGEGGAGTFSDGKLISRIKSPYRDFFMRTLVHFGAPPDILVEAQAHVGSNQLRRITARWREALIAKGVDYRFDSRVDDLLVEESVVKGVVLASGEKILADRVFFAVGGHARDSLEILVRQGVKIEPRDLAVGLRIEHPQKLINKSLTGEETGPACEYRLKTQVDDHGVYSFCMCPGGVVVAAASEPGYQVVNGMSYQGKKSPYANSALVVTVGKEYFPKGPLGGLFYQRELEKKCFELAGGSYRAPAQKLKDFLANCPSQTLPKSSYRPTLWPCNLRDILPAYVTYALLQALPEFDKKLKGYLDPEALLIGPETRTSCPITVLRSEDMSASLKNLYCVGEGAGYSGGILSSAFDAMKVLNHLGKT
jgi:uncharacterized FAD-dependent dehydrogenase